MIVIILIYFCVVSALATDVGTFWAINDVHWQWNYIVGSNEKESCIEGEGDAGLFGHPRCSAPFTLVESAVKHMKSIQPNPDFIAYLGDLPPSCLKNDWNRRRLKEMSTSFTSYITEQFSTPFVWTIGNHDVVNVNHFGKTSDYVFQDLYPLWKDHIPLDQGDNFLKGGYYRVDHSPTLSFLVLNTAYYFVTNPETVHMDDPGDQFVWIEEQIEYLKKTNRVALVFMHCPLGVTESVATPVPNLIPKFNDKLLEVFEKGIECNVISAIFSGHEHTQALRLVFSERLQKPGIPLFISPSLVYYSELIVVGNNPGVRLYHYNRTSGVILNYEQFFLNLTKANSELFDHWELEHDARELFKVSDLSANGVYQAWKNLSSDKKMLKTYIKYNTVGVPNSSYGNAALVRHLCAIRYSSFSDFVKCYV
ncbi:hypothetical protein GEMRC1_003485 [Eukaryota sp. GEM-RC1]